MLMLCRYACYAVMTNIVFSKLGTKIVFHRYAKCSSLRNKNGLRFGNLTPSPILPNLLFAPNCTSSFFPVLPLFQAELR